MTAQIDSIGTFCEWLNSQPRGPIVTNKQRASVSIWLNELFDGDEGRHEFLRWAFDVESSKDLIDTQLNALRHWLGVRKDDDTGTWTIRAECYQTAKLWRRTRQIAAGQLDMFGETDNDN